MTRAADHVPERISWAVELVDPAGPDSIVEIGCGPGVAAALVCDRLADGGHLLAVDRSPVAVERTRRRNARHLESGRLSVRQSTLAELEAPPGNADKAFTVNVNVFWTGDAAPELAVLHALLRPGGRLYLLYGGGPTGTDRVSGPIERKLRAGGFTDVEVVAGEVGTGVLARRPDGAARVP